MYFPEAGAANTDTALELAIAAAQEHNLSHLVIASVTGQSVRKALARPHQGLQIVCVSHHVGFTAPGQDELEAETRAWLQQQGVPVLTTTHLLAGADRALRFKFGGIYPPEIIANTLRMFGQGVKVAVEVAVMALDAGLIPYGVPVVATGGTGRGIDTAIVVVPQHSTDIFGVKVQEIICKPRAW